MCKTEKYSNDHQKSKVTLKKIIIINLGKKLFVQNVNIRALRLFPDRCFPDRRFPEFGLIPTIAKMSTLIPTYTNPDQGIVNK